MIIFNSICYFFVENNKIKCSVTLSLKYFFLYNEDVDLITSIHLAAPYMVAEGDHNKHTQIHILSLTIFYGEVICQLLVDK